MSCPFLREIVMAYCSAYPVKKMVPKDRMTEKCACTCDDFSACSLFRRAHGAPAAGPTGPRRAHSGIEGGSHVNMNRRTFLAWAGVAGAGAAVGGARLAHGAPSRPIADDTPVHARRHHQVPRLPRLRGGLQRGERAAGARAGRPEDRLRQVPRDEHARVHRGQPVPGPHQGRGAGLRQAAVHALRGAGVRLGVPGPGADQDPRRAGRLQPEGLHRLPLLHGGLPLRHPQVRVREGAPLHQEVQLLPRAPASRASSPPARTCARRARSPSASARTCSSRRARRIYQSPDKYIHYVYGEHEAGGTGWLYISSVDFAGLSLQAGPDLVLRRADLGRARRRPHHPDGGAAAAHGPLRRHQGPRRATRSPREHDASEPRTEGSHE